MTGSNFNIQEYLSEGVEIILKDAIHATLKIQRKAFICSNFQNMQERQQK
ncbi:MAG: hypothetical protein J6S29_01125 [Methanosphaera sp.]|nr:hypothetical protein [Methanosphaera sp.]